MALKIVKKTHPVATKYGYVTRSKLTQKYIRKLWDKEMESENK